MAVSDFWQGRKVLVTGHTGFKGSWLSLWLQRAGAELVGYALPPPTEPSLFELARVGGHMLSIEGDVRDLGHLGEVMAEHQPEIVIHMAAQAIVRFSYEDPLETYSTNVVGTLNVLEALRRDPCATALVVVTSDKCYENVERVEGYVEEEPLGGRDPYSSSKACAEIVTRAYRDSFLSDVRSSIAVASARAGNVIGGGDWADARVVPDIMRAFLDSEALYLRNPQAVRPWQHVLDPVSGYLLLAEKLYQDGSVYGEAWNFAPADDHMLTVAEMVTRFRELWDTSIEVSLDPGPHPHEHDLLLLDPGKARRRLGWWARLSQEEACRWVVEWFRAYREESDMRATSLEQIERYLGLEAPSGGAGGAMSTSRLDPVLGA